MVVPKIRVSVIFYAKFKKTAQGRDVVTDQIQHTYGIERAARWCRFVSFEMGGNIFSVSSGVDFLS